MRALPLRKELAVYIGYECLWAPEPVHEEAKSKTLLLLGTEFQSSSF